MDVAEFSISWRELLDIGLVALIYYYLISLVRGTRAVPVIYGLFLLLIVYHASGELGFYTLNWLLTNFLGSIFLVIIILFQKDIRKGLSQVGAGWFARKQPIASEVLDEIVSACVSMGRRKVGALIVMEKTVGMADVIESGVDVNSAISRELLMTIFHPDTPLHDGAVVIKNARLMAAGCILPLSLTTDLDSSMGTRHRAALGISEESDAVVVVVSEETGKLSVTRGGRIATVRADELAETLRAAME